MPNKIKEIRQYCELYFDKNGREPSVGLVAAKFDMPIEKMKSVFNQLGWGGEKDSDAQLIRDAIDASFEYPFEKKSEALAELKKRRDAGENVKLTKRAGTYTQPGKGITSFVEYYVRPA